MLPPFFPLFVSEASELVSECCGDKIIKGAQVSLFTASLMSKTTAYPPYDAPSELHLRLNELRALTSYVNEKA